MAQLFKNKTLKAELKDYQVPDFENKLAIVKSWHEAYKNGSLQKKTESQCEQTFNQSFFVEVLGYKSFPSEVYTIDPKGSTESGGQKPDAILGYFSHDTKRVVAVVEIKDVHTPLDKSQQREGNLSPVQQAFKYKPQFKDCSFVIATNFYELRLLKDNQLDFEQFTLDDLVSDKDDYFAFKKFYYLLNAENFVTKQGVPKTEKILAAIRIEEEAISKAFYKEYRILRQDLIHNIVLHNQTERGITPLVIEKAQKIIDRIVFICFCEDLGLLPENKLLEVIQYGQNSPLPPPIWDTLKQFFTAIDSGSEKLGIPNGYNGELFKEDAQLNALKIADPICKKFTEFGKYDFAEDLSVNILGHIFEQSISDIEELKKFTSPAEMDQAVSKRKKDGIFYTPDYIVNYIVANSLGKYLEELESEVLAKHKLKVDIKDENYEKRAKKAYVEYWEKLKNIKVLDPACGSGAFLVKVFDFLFAEYQRVGGILGLNKGMADFTSVYKNILQQNIYGVDLNPESVEITKLSLWLKTANKGQKLVTLKDNIKCGDSLIDDVSAGTRAFSWEKEFEHIISNGGFDVIVGNPPYVLCQPSNTPVVVLDYYKKMYEVASYKIDLFHLFFEKGIKLLRKNGELGFITPNTYMTNKHIEPLRRFILENSHINEIILFDGDVFDEASVDTSAILLKVNPEKIQNEIIISRMDHAGQTKTLNKLRQSDWHDLDGMSFNVNISDEKPLKLKNTVKLGEIASTYFGIQAFDRDSSISTEKLSSDYLPMIDGKDVVPYNSLCPTLFFNYKEGNIKSGGDKSVYSQDRIVIRQIGATPLVGYCPSGVLTSNTIYNVFLKTDGFLLKYILCLLNSRLIKYYWESHYSDNKKTFPKIKGYQLKELPIAKAIIDDQKPFVELADHMIVLNRGLNEKIEQFQKFIATEFGLAKWNKQLSEFYKMEFAAFFNALKIQHIPLTKKAELMDFFEKNKGEVAKMRSEIDSLVSSIDDMVFDLYKLTPEERAIILQAS